MGPYNRYETPGALKKCKNALAGARAFFMVLLAEAWEQTPLFPIG